MEHTEGKFSIEEGIMTHTILDEEGNTIAFTNTFNSHRFVDFERLVACWNAFEGMPLELIKDNVVVETLDKQLSKALNLLEIAIAERDKERAMRKIALEALGEIRHYDDIDNVCGDIANQAIKQVIQEGSETCL